MKAATALMAIVAIVLGALLYRQEVAFKSQQHQIDQLRQSLKTSTEAKQASQQTASIEYQAKCAEQAKHEFEDMGFKPNNMASFVNHYNAKLNTCFIQVESMDISNPKMMWTHRFVNDAFEGKAYGRYDWHTEKDKKYWEVPPFHCSVVSLGGEEQTCTSDDEFKNLVKVYMGD